MCAHVPNARAHTHTRRETRANASPSLSLPPADLTSAGQEDAALTHLKEYLSGVCNGDVTFVWGVDKRGARTRRCSRAEAAV